MRCCSCWKDVMKKAHFGELSVVQVLLVISQLPAHVSSNMCHIDNAIFSSHTYKKMADVRFPQRILSRYFVLKDQLHLIPSIFKIRVHIIILILSLYYSLKLHILVLILNFFSFVDLLFIIVFICYFYCLLFLFFPYFSLKYHLLFLFS